MISLERREMRTAAVPSWLVGTISIPLALVAGAALLWSTGQNPYNVYEEIITTAFGSTEALSATLVSMTPLLLTGLCAAVAFRMNLFNIGGEGQLYVGAIAGAGAGLALHGGGRFIVIVSMVLAGAGGGILWVAIPAVLKTALNVNEILSSLMLNYVAGLLMLYLIFDSRSYWRDVSSPGAQTFPHGKILDTSAWWPQLEVGGVTFPFGLLVGVGASVILYVLLRSTRFGFRIRVISDSPGAAAYAGFRVGSTTVLVMLLSGALAGLAGASQVGDFSHILDPEGVQLEMYGYTGIIVAALARYSPLGCVIPAFLLGGLNNAALQLQGPTFPVGLTGTLEGVILACVVGTEFLGRYSIRLKRREGEARGKDPNGASGGGARSRTDAMPS